MMYFYPASQTFSAVPAENSIKVNRQTRNLISTSLTGGGEVWVENNRIYASGPAPAPGMRFDRQTREWQVDHAAREQLLADTRTLKLHMAADAAQDFIRVVAGLDTVPPFERDSWATQAMEAQAWAADPQAATPILAGIARARGVHVDILRQKALAKARAFAALTASIAGQRQAYEDAIRAADSLEALDAITIRYIMPMIPMAPAQGGDA